MPACSSDELVQLCVDYLKAYPAQVGTGACISAALLVALLVVCMREGELQPEEEEEREEEENNENKKDL